MLTTITVGEAGTMTTTIRERRIPPSTLGPMIATARLRAGLHGRECARRAGVSPGYLVNLEKGRRLPSRTMVHRLHTVLSFTEPELAELLAVAVNDAGQDHPLRHAS